MIGLVPIGRFIALVAVLYAVLISGFVAAAVEFGDDSWSIWINFTYIFSGATLLQILLALSFCYGWRHLWRWFPTLNHLLYPDLGGEWDIRIHWQSSTDDGTIDARAVVRQNFLQVSMEVLSENSDSKTLIAQPRKDPESGTPFLYYVYQVNPKFIGPEHNEPYFGAAILKYSQVEEGGNLSGNYWTTRATRGHFNLRRQT